MHNKLVNKSKYRIYITNKQIDTAMGTKIVCRKKIINLVRDNKLIINSLLATG